MRKISSRGWLCAALSRERDVYLWGGRLGTRERDIGRERDDASDKQDTGRREKPDIRPERDDDTENEEVRLLRIPAEADVVDVAVGDGCVLVLTAQGKVWARGEGEWGQLGTGKKEFGDRWVEVRVEGWEERPGEGGAEEWGKEKGRGRKIVGVEGGVWNSFLLVRV